MSGKMTELHKTLIQKLLDDIPSCSAKGFWNAHDALRKSLGLEPLRVRIRPDAFRINHESSEIEIYEVEVESVLTSAKIRELGVLWEEWDAEGTHDWLPVLFVVDRYGNINRLDLMDAYHESGWAAALIK